MFSIFQNGIAWAKKVVSHEESLLESLSISGFADQVRSQLPDWKIQTEVNGRFLIFKEFESKNNGKVAVALQDGKAVVFEDTNGRLLNLDILGECLLRNENLRINPVVSYNQQFDCYTWLDTNYTVFEPDTLSQITSAMSVVTAKIA